MSYNIQTQVVIQSATITLTGEQLQALSRERQTLVELAASNGGLAAVRELLNAISNAAKGSQVAPAKKPLTEAQRLHLADAQKKAREAIARRKAAHDAQADIDDSDDDDDEDAI